MLQVNNHWLTPIPAALPTVQVSPPSSMQSQPLVSPWMVLTTAEEGIFNATTGDYTLAPVDDNAVAFAILHSPQLP